MPATPVKPNTKPRRRPSGANAPAATADHAPPQQTETVPAPVESLSTVIAGTAETTMVLPGLGAGETAVVSSADPSGPAAESSVVQTPVVEAPPAPPPAAPTISLEGLPEPPPELAYVIVNEAGASDYSASPVAKEEFPGLDATTRDSPGGNERANRSIPGHAATQRWPKSTTAMAAKTNSSASTGNR